MIFYTLNKGDKMKRIEEYKVVYCRSSTDIANDINYWIDNGWEPIGNLIVGST